MEELTTPEKRPIRPAAHEREGRKGSRTLAFFAGLSLLLVSGAISFYFLVTKPAQLAAISTVDRAEKFFKNILQGEGSLVRTEGVNLLKVEDAAEIVLLEYKLKVNREMEHEHRTLRVLSSSKELGMEATFRMKIGYDISDGLVVVEGEDGQIRIEGLNGPHVLSAEMLDVRTTEDKSGLWNKVSLKDRDALTKNMRFQAIREVEQSGLLEQSDQNMKANLRSLLGVEELEFDAMSEIRS